MKYKLMAIDLDGTLTNQQKVVTPPTLQALMQAQEQGLRLIIASGRPTHGVLPIATLLQLSHFGGFLLSYNGAEIYDCQAQKMIYQQAIDPSFLPSIYQYARDHHFAVETFMDDQAITEQPDDPYIQRQAWINRLNITKVTNWVGAIDFPVMKCLIVGEPERLVQLEQIMLQELEGKLNICRSEPYFLEIVAKDVDKASALSRLLDYTKCKREELVAVGDSYNDISMIRLAGLGVAMANAPEIVRQHADYITLSNEDDGVADLIYKILKEKI